MAKLLYVEPDDEVTDLIDRIRRSTADRELVFVVPAGARVLHAPLNLQLLQQYARGFQKTAAIVSEDPRTQGLSIRAGFPTFTSLASWEGGSPVTEPPTAGASASGSGASGLQRAAVGGAAVAAGGAAAAVAERPVRSLTPRPSGRAVPPPTPRSGGRGAALRPWGIGAGALVFLMGLLALLFVVPSATLTVVVRAQQLSDQVTLQGTTISSQASQLDFVQTKALQTAPASGSVRVVPTGIKNIPAVKATGMEALAWDQTYQGTVCLDPNPKGGFATQGGTAFGFPGVSHQSPCHSTPGSLAVVLPACVPGAGSPPATCSPGSYGPYSTPFPIAAVTAGTTGNVGAGTITNWTSDPCAVPNPPSKCTLFGHTLTGQDFSATNPQATSGGVAAKSETIFTSQNQATATQQIDQVVSRLTTKLVAALRQQVGSLTIASTGPGNGITVSVTRPQLPKVGSVATSQTMTVTAFAAATAFDPGSARQAVLRDLRSKVPGDGALLPGITVGSTSVVAAAPGGTLTLSATAVGFWAPRLNLAPLAADLPFKSPSNARAFLLTQVPAAVSVRISQSPFGLPWLPLLRSHIRVQRLALRASPGTAA